MKNHILRKADAYAARRHSRQIRNRIVGSLACVVALGTIYTLMLPAATLENPSCGLEEHTHTQTCYTKVETEAYRELACTTDSLNVHTHTDSCYGTDGALVCGCSDFVVHTHDASCYDADGALVCTLPEIEAHTHDAGCYTQHVHGEDCYTRTQGELICTQSTEPVLACDKEEIILHTHTDACYETNADGNKYLVCGQQEVLEHVHTDSCFQTVPAADALTCGMSEGEGAHTHSAECYDGNDTLICEQEESEGHQHSEICYGTWELTCTLPEHTHTDACNSSQDPEYTCGLTGHTHSVENGCYDEDGTTLICEQEEHTHTSLCLLTPEDRVQVQAVIDLIDALPTEAEIEQTFTALLEAEDEAGYEAALMDLILKAREAYDAYSALSEELKPEVTNADKLMALQAYWDGDIFDNVNPSFTVQYYANLPVAVESDSGPLTLIDTSEDGDGDGGNLPQNGVTGSDMPTMSLCLEEASNGKYQVAMTTALTKVYEPHGYKFATAHELQYIDRLAENGNYELSKIWVLNDGASPNSTNEKDWTTYSKDAGFTNNPEVADDNTILIEDNTVIRLVYDTTDSVYTNAVNFYDYDITDDGQVTNTNGQGYGINSTSNYSGSGSKLAFGNKNTGTPYGETAWNGNYINKYNGANSSNQYGYLGCTFGLVEELDSSGNIIYADNIDAPDLFNEGSAIGKTTYANKYSLNFNREGDTYTLSSVGGSEVSGLEYFNHPTYVRGSTGDTINYTHIWTNNFWPMDGEKNSDPHTGYDKGTVLERGTYNNGDTYPPSDDGIAHNNMFGMQYSVQFTLTKDYVGPLEYYFFGDDDMWVFLDGKLVCDIGGVHSSVGEYVNLWDYITKGSSGTHTLSFFYTERGLSGSTCYMQFTLPSVTSATPGQQLGFLQVEKEVTGQNTDQEFKFTLGLSGDNQYPYSKMKSDGSVVSTGNIVDGGTFTLSDGQYIVVNNLPYGTNFTVTETAVDGCTVTNTVNSITSADGKTATGTISAANQDVVVHYTNLMSPKLPDTGGSGTLLYTIGGLLVMASAASLLLYKSRCRYKL